jgi:hypothetical protein
MHSCMYTRARAHTHTHTRAEYFGGEGNSICSRLLRFHGWSFLFFSPPFPPFFCSFFYLPWLRLCFGFLRSVSPPLSRSRARTHTRTHTHRGGGSGVEHMLRSDWAHFWIPRRGVSCVFLVLFFGVVYCVVVDCFHFWIPLSCFFCVSCALVFFAGLLCVFLFGDFP